MKTPMNVFNTAMKKKKKNRKGFSLVELIVVLVIMAILAAALVPTLIGYIKQTKQSNAKNEAAAVVSAAQTIASSAFANGDGMYYDQSQDGAAIEVVVKDDKVVAAVDGDASTKALTAISKLSETDKAGGTIKKVTFIDGVVSRVEYSNGGTNVLYTAPKDKKGTYSVVDKFESSTVS